MILSPKKRYLQLALNSTLDEAYKIIRDMPLSDRIIIEAGTPFIKRYGVSGIRQLYDWYQARQRGEPILFAGTDMKQAEQHDVSLKDAWQSFKKTLQESKKANSSEKETHWNPYIVADLKTFDRGETEVAIAHEGKASAAIALGAAPIETLNAFIEACNIRGIDSMIDMMNVEYPLSVLTELIVPPSVVILHRGVDEEAFNKEKQIPLHEIRRVKGRFDTMISVAGGDTLREAQRAFFNDADIVVIWKPVFRESGETIHLIDEFLKEVQ